MFNCYFLCSLVYIVHSLNSTHFGCNPEKCCSKMNVGTLNWYSSHGLTCYDQLFKTSILNTNITKKIK